MNLTQEAYDKTYFIRIVRYDDVLCSNPRWLRHMYGMPTREFKNAKLLYVPTSADGLVHFLTENNALVAVPWDMIVYIIPSLKEVKHDNIK